MLANVILYLKDTARAWFETHEAQLASRELCKSKLQELLGKPVGRERLAENPLATRAQSEMESYMTYIQDIRSLCQKADGTMFDSTKVEYILKGIADDALNLLVFTNCTTVADVVTACRRFEQTKSRRKTRNFQRVPNTSSTSLCETTFIASGPSTEEKTRIVWCKLSAMLPPNVAPRTTTITSFPSSLYLMQAVVRREISNYKAPVCPPETP